MADGRAIRAVVRELIRAKPKRPPLKRLSTLHPLFFPLGTLIRAAMKSAQRVLRRYTAMSLASRSGLMATAMGSAASPIIDDLRGFELLFDPRNSASAERLWGSTKV
jgi:hypothetical protein